MIGQKSDIDRNETTRPGSKAAIFTKRERRYSRNQEISLELATFWLVLHFFVYLRGFMKIDSTTQREGGRERVREREHYSGQGKTCPSERFCED